eukprot:7403277-Heterocapsa_arctica.AAC.1
MDVIVQFDQIGETCCTVKTPEDLTNNKILLCGGGPNTKCLMCKSIKTTKEMSPIPEMDKVKGICKFLADKAEKTWKEMTPMEQLVLIAISFSDKPEERQLLSQCAIVKGRGDRRDPGTVQTWKPLHLRDRLPRVRREEDRICVLQGFRERR